LQGEQLYHIEGLALDDAAAIDDARALFIQAAGRLRPDFQATAENMSSLNQICRLVEGMPLAIELAAAWIDLFTLEDIAAGIRRNLDFLESDLRDMPSRHRSMQAVFETSWQQLSADLQQVLAAVAVFRGGFTREAATAVTEASRRDLATLVNKSLLSFDPKANRYHIHELLRQYSLKRLTNSEVRNRHCAYYLDWLIQQSPKLTGAEQDLTRAQVETEMDNIRVVINQALRIRKVDDFEPVMRTLIKVYDAIRFQEGVLLFDHIRTELIAAPDTPPRILFWVIACQVRALSITGQRAKVRRLWPKGQALLVELTAQNGDLRAEQAFSYHIDGFQLLTQQPAKARQLLQQSYDLAVELGDLWLVGSVLRGLALAARNQGDLAAAEAALTERLAIFQTLHDRQGIVLTQLMLGNLAGIDGRYDEAEKQLLSGIDAARLLQPTMVAYGLNKLQMVYFFSGRFEDARAPLAEEGLLCDETGFIFGVARNKVSQGLLYLHQGRYREANEEGEKTVSLGQENVLNNFTCEALVLLAQTEIATGNYLVAKERLQESDKLCPSRPVGTQSYVAGNDLYWAILEAATGNTAVAWQHLRSEIYTAVKRKHELSLANALAAIAFLYATENEASSALEMYELARQHPFVAHSHWFADVVGERITAVAATLSPEAAAAALARGQEMDMWETAESWLDY
jgi:tetratricopeptide (TPR) repeat protein